LLDPGRSSAVRRVSQRTGRQEQNASEESRAARSGNQPPYSKAFRLEWIVDFVTGFTRARDLKSPAPPYLLGVSHCNLLPSRLPAPSQAAAIPLPITANKTRILVLFRASPCTTKNIGESSHILYL
jgi:hypothetical protein